MKHTFKWALAGLTLAIVGVGVIVGLVALSQWRSLPSASATVALAGLDADVEVVRDASAVPHVIAQSHRDAVMTLGYLHAQERLWQMEVLRRTAQGRLSELFGEATADLDVFLRTLGFENSSRRSLDALSPETLVLLQAYAAGVNAYSTRDLRRLEARFGPEFGMLGATPEPWEPHHSLGILKVMSLQLSKNMGEELQRLHYAAQGLSSAEIADLMKAHPDDELPPLPDLSNLLSLKRGETVRTSAVDLGIASNLGTWASNNWVLSGARTTTGSPMLANDPHLLFGAPSLWYLAHLSYPDPARTGERVELIGASLPATPLILLGRNEHVAWGFTNAGADVQDIFIERLRPDDENQYLTPDGWQTFALRDEVVKVTGGSDIDFTVRTGRHGPVLPDKLAIPVAEPLVFSDVLADRHVPALAWTGLSDRDNSIDAVARLGSARTVEDLRAAFETLRSPMQAIVMADRTGSIGLVTPASVPLRAPSNAVRGRAPVPGWLPEFDWVREIRADELAAVMNPSSGAIATANTRLPTADRAFLTSDWDVSDRLDRAEELVVDPAAPQSLEDMADAQNDVMSRRLARLRTIMLERSGDDLPWRDRLRAWNGRMDRKSAEPLVMLAWLRETARLVFEDDLGSAFRRFQGDEATALTRVLGEGGARDWCDDRRTADAETCAGVLTAAMRAALADLEDRYGDPSDWTYGAAHTVFGKHQPFGGVPLLGRLFNVEAPASGGPYTLNRGQTSLQSDDPFKASHGAGYKAIYDLGSPDSSLFVQNSGQSGHPFSKHYRDMVGTWANGGYVPMVTTRERYERGALGTATFTAD